jgi:hypothetical protein
MNDGNRDPDEVAAELEAAVEKRLAARREAAKRRKAERKARRALFAARRTAGLRVRHARKENRT